MPLVCKRNAFLPNELHQVCGEGQQGTWGGGGGGAALISNSEIGSGLSNSSFREGGRGREEG